MSSKYFLTGEKIALRSPEKSDYVESIVRWYNDHEVTKYLNRGINPYSVEDAAKDFESLAKETDGLTLSLCDLKSGKLIGIVGLHSQNWIARSTEFRILVGEKDFWGKGLGKEATMLMVAYAFERLNMHRVWLGVNAENKSAAETYLKTNFKIEGELREDFFRNGRFYNVLRMGLLRGEYEEVKKTWPIFSLIKGQLL